MRLVGRRWVKINDGRDWRTLAGLPSRAKDFAAVPVLGHRVIALGHASVDRDGTGNGINDAGEPDQRPTAQELDGAAVRFGDRQVDRVAVRRRLGFRMSASGYKQTF